MRNSTKMGGAIKKKYQVGGKVNNGRKGLDPVKDIDAFKKGAIKNPNMKMNPSKIQVGTTKPMTPAEKAKKMQEFMNMAPKKKMGGAKKYQKGGAIIASPISGPRRKVAGSNMAKGGSLKMVNPSANPGLAKLPAPVRNKMGYAKKGGAKKYANGGPGDPPKTAGQAYMKYVPNAAASDTLASQGDARFQQPYYEDDNFTAKKKMLEMTYGNETPDPEFGTQRRQQTPQEVTGYQDFLRGMYNKKNGGVVKKKGGQAHPGFKAVQAKIAAKSGVSKKAAGAILASSTRKASAKAKAANPRLKRVKG